MLLIVAMTYRAPKIHLEIQYSGKKPVGILRSSYREDGKIKHKQFGRIPERSLQELKILQLALRGHVISADSPDAFKIIKTKEYGASCAILRTIEKLELDKILYSRSEPWVDSVMAMIAGRILFAGSKLSLCNEYKNTSLWEQVGIMDRPDVEEHCYAAMDRLLERQHLIQKALAKKHLQGGSLVLYDITSSYMEGKYENSELVTYGYNRDGKSKHEQIVIGLLCNKEGCPVGVEVFSGNTKDESTVVEKIREVKEKYGVTNIIFVGDRGMVTRSNLEKLKNEENLRTITALKRNEINELLNRDVIQLSLFDERNIIEIKDPDHKDKRYCLCRNPLSAERNKKTRDRLLELTKDALDKIANYKKSTKVETLGARIGKALSKWKMEKFVQWEVILDKEKEQSNQHKVIWKFDDQKIKDAEALDGCYIITTNVPAQEMSAQEVVASYKRLTLVEQAFSQLKTLSLEVRPVYHKTDDRIRAHVFLCMLSYYVQWHMQQALAPILARNGNGKNREQTFSNIISTLKQITRNTVSVKGAEFEQITTPNKEQEEILKLLSVTIK